jgi:spermidine synthase
LHQLDLETLRSIVRTFTTVYPRSWALLATNSLDTPIIGLIARRDGERFAIDRLRGRLTRAVAPNPGEFGIADDLALLGSFVAGPESLKRFGAGAPLNTDDRPVVTYRAPWITYARDSLPRDRLVELVHELEIRPHEIVALRDDEASWAARLQAYATARNRYLEIGRDIRPSADVRQMLLQAREPLFAVLHISPDFRPAYDPLLRMATAVAQVDASAARALLTELERVQPARDDAVEALKALPYAR